MEVKKICKLVKKDIIKESPETFLKIVLNATFYCEKCGRVANNPEYLCKPVKLSND